MGRDTMEIHVKESKIIRPAEETPKHCLRMSLLDLLMPTYHIPCVYFYRRRSNDSCNFFEADVLKEALSKVLVPFYPMAGRLLGKDENGRFEVRCNGDGVLFVEAETSCSVDDLGNFESSSKLMELVPQVDDTQDPTSYPLFMAQVTHFKCGGVCLGVMTCHMLIDAITAYHFTNSWAEMTRGVPISIPPNFDRSILAVGVPNSPSFHHIEYDQPPVLNTFLTKKPETIISTAILEISPDQMNTLREKCKKKDHGSYCAVKYSKFEIVASHIWRCVCKARGLFDDQASKLDIPISGRFKLNPKIPPGYIGNVIFSAAPIALSGDLESEPLNRTVERIHQALKQMDNKYLKSALAFLKQQHDLTTLMEYTNNYDCPNLLITKLADLPMYDANFGWGRPVFTRPVTDSDGEVFIISGPKNDGSWLVIIDLESNHLQIFKKLFYGIFL